MRCFAVWCPGLVESSGCSRNDNRHKLMHEKFKAETQKLWNMRIKAISVAFIHFLVHVLIYAFIIYHCQTTLPHFSAWSQFPDVVASVPLGSISPPGVCSWLLPGPSPTSPALKFCCFPLHVIWAMRDYGGSPGTEMTGIAFWCSLLVPRAAAVSNSQEGSCSKESPEQSPEESPRSPKMEWDQGRQNL